MIYKGLKIYQRGIKTHCVDIDDSEIKLNGYLWIDFINTEIDNIDTIVATMRFEKATKKDVQIILQNLIKNKIPIMDR